MSMACEIFTAWVVLFSSVAKPIEEYIIRDTFTALTNRYTTDRICMLYIYCM